MNNDAPIDGVEEWLSNNKDVKTEIYWNRSKNEKKEDDRENSGQKMDPKAHFNNTHTNPTPNIRIYNFNRSVDRLFYSKPKKHNTNNNSVPKPKPVY